jgi:uncharacterized iron-regulated membrane protein
VKPRWYEITANKVLAFALICVAVSSAFVMWQQYRVTNILAAPDWCIRAINAEKLSTVRTESAFERCVQLLDKQVGSLAISNHIYAGIIALCLLVLMVIVVAGGRLKFRASKDEVEADISRDPAAAAQKTADAAQEKADAIDKEVNQ